MSHTPTGQPKPPWINHFHLVVPNATGAAILMIPTAQGWALPYARGEDFWLADTGQIAAHLAASLDLGFRFTLLRYLAIEEGIEADNTQRWDRILFVLEPAHPLIQPPLHGQWIDSATLRELPLAFPDRRAALLAYLEETQAEKHAVNGSPTDAPIDVRRAPWARVGWFAQASAWIEEAIGALGYVQTGDVEPLRNWSISSVLTAPTSAGRVYFKAAAALPLFVNEPVLTQTLAQLFPRHLPTPLKIDPQKRWMLMADFGTTARSATDADYAPIMQAYGALQRASVDHLDALHRAGCINRRLDVLSTQIDHLIAHPITQSVITPQEFEKLVALAPLLKERCATLAQYNIPATLLHGDLHMGNIALRDSTLRDNTTRHGESLFFDWTDAAISFPFFDMIVPYFELDAVEAAPVRDAYLRAWHNDESPERLLEAWEMAKPLCALHHSISYLTIVENIELLAQHELMHGLPDNLRNLLACFE